MARGNRIRLDSLLSQRGLFESRSQAAASVLAGNVLLLPGRLRAEKPGQLVCDEVEVEVAAAPRFVSRGGVKLESALEALAVDVSGRTALDVGASTGGFTDCMLQRGAAHVIALDVAYGQLHWRLRSDPKVTVLERINARTVSPSQLPYRPELIALDVSFISLRKVLGPVLACAAQRFDCLALVKPQFEAGREAVGKGGVVRDASAREQALLGVGLHAQELGVAVCGYASSGLPGPKGNRETFVWLAERARGGIQDLERAIRSAGA
jgi:23S rRNA (cytidine1920-2'-O)/16S rRNA (cytidine1409-2'-O)-methyltransferase